MLGSVIYRVEESATVLDADDAAAVVEDHGLVLESARGPLPRLVELIAGETIDGSWWGHPAGRHVYRVLSELRDRDDLAVFRLVDGKLTYVHRRVWPALVLLAERIGPHRLAAVEEVHTARGHHETVEIPFPEWVPAEVVAEARRLAEAEASRLVAVALED